MVIYGVNPVLEALRSNPRRVTRVLLRRGKATGRLGEIVELARSAEIAVRFESSNVLEKKAGSTRHQGAVAELSGIQYRSLQDLLAGKPDLLLMIDGVEDPRNLGAVIRTADAAGVDGILIPDRHACGVTPAVVKASAGAALVVPVVQIGNLVQTLELLKQEGLWTAGLDMSGDTLPWELDAGLRLVLVVGSESKGLRRLVREHCDFLVSLPMFGTVSSLNLSVAAAIVMYEVVAQRIRKSPPGSGG